MCYSVVLLAIGNKLAKTTRRHVSKDLKVVNVGNIRNDAVSRTTSVILVFTVRETAHNY